MKVAFLVISTLFCSILAAKLPSDFRVCKRGDSDLKNCLKLRIQETLSMLVEGIPELGVSGLEPLIIPSATIGEGKGAVNVVQNYKNFTMYNLTGSKIENVEATFTDTYFKIDIDAFSPEYRIQADYDFNGRILLLPIVGAGKCNITFNDVKTNLHISGDTVQKKGKTFLTVKDCTERIEPGKVTYNFENLFNGDERLGKEINHLLNENWKEVFEDVRTGYEEVLASVFRSYINNIFSKAPYEELLPKSAS